MTRFARTVVTVIGLASVAACGDPVAEERLRVAPGPADPKNARVVETGEALYLAHCASCHGTELRGQPNWQEPLPDGGYPAPPHDGSGHTWRHSDRELFEATKFGGAFSAAPDSVSHMPAFDNVLSDDEIWAALAFVKSRWPTELQARQALLTRMRSHGQHTRHEGHSGNAADSDD